LEFNHDDEKISFASGDHHRTIRVHPDFLFSINPDHEKASVFDQVWVGE
jgi:hypothetical protein